MLNQNYELILNTHATSLTTFKGRHIRYYILCIQKPDIIQISHFMLTLISCTVLFINDKDLSSNRSTQTRAQRT